MSDALIECDVDGEVATVTFSRPEHDNVVSWEMLKQCDAELSAVTDSDAAVLVLRGEGANFSIGRDQNEDLGDVPREEILKTIISVNESLTEFPGVAIALVQGKALGFACGVATQCDMTVAADTAEFGFDEIKHGFAPKIVLSYIETYVSRKDAQDLVMTGRTVSADEASAVGLVNHVVAAEQLDAYGQGLVESFLELNSDALTECKFFPRRVQTIDPDEVDSFILDEML